MLVCSFSFPPNSFIILQTSPDLTTWRLYHRWKSPTGTTLPELHIADHPKVHNPEKSSPERAGGDFQRSPVPSLAHGTCVIPDRMLIFGVLRPSVLEMLPPPQAVSCSASLFLSQEGFNLNLSYCNLSSLLLVLSSRGVEIWLFPSSLQQSFTFLRIVLLTQTLLYTKSTIWGEVYLSIAEASILWAIMSTGSTSIVNSLYKMNWKLKWNLIEKLTLWEFILPLCCALKYKQDYFWLMCNWNKNKQT